MKNHNRGARSELAVKLGKYLLDQGARPADMYEAAGQVYVAICEGGLFSATSERAREEIRASMVADLSRVVEHLRTWTPPSPDEFEAKHGKAEGSKWDAH